jgi:WD40 repeat protein
VNSVDFSPDGALLASGSSDGTARLWDVQTGKPVGDLIGHRGEVLTVAFDSVGRQLASAGDDATLRIWSVRSRRPLQRIALSAGEIRQMVFTEEDTRLVLGSDSGGVEYWDLAGADEGFTLRNRYGTAASVDFSPDGKGVAVGGDDNQLATAGRHPSTVNVYDIVSGKIAAPLHGHQNGVNCVAFSPDGKRLASGDKDGNILLWERTDNRSYRTWRRIPIVVKHPAEVTGVVFVSRTALISGSRAPDGKRSEVQATTLRQSEAESIRIPYDGASVFSLAYCPENRLLASGDGVGRVFLWSVGSDGRPRKHNRPLYTQGSSVWGVALDRRGVQLASASTDNSVRVYNILQGRVVDTYTHDGSVYSVAFSPANDWLASAGTDGDIRLRRIGSLGNKQEMILRWHEQPVSWVAFSGDGTYLAAAGLDSQTHVWRMAALAKVFSAPAPTLAAEAAQHGEPLHGNVVPAR